MAQIIWSTRRLVKVLLTANAKDVEVIKKVHGFWVIQLKYVPLKLDQMEMFLLGKSGKIFQIKKFL